MTKMNDSPSDEDQVTKSSADRIFRKAEKAGEVVSKAATKYHADETPMNAIIGLLEIVTALDGLREAISIEAEILRDSKTDGAEIPLPADLPAAA